MKLLLTSQGTVNKKVMDEMIRLCGKDPKDTSILFITTAAKVVKNPEYMYKELARLRENNFKLTEFDLDGRSVNDVAKKVNENDIVFVVGGEPFYLLKAVRESGFDEVIKNQSNGKVYVGASAGSYIACKSVEMGLWKKPQRNTYGLTDFTGMGLVDFLIMAHLKDEYKQLFEKKSKEVLPTKTYALTDMQALSIVGNNVKFIE